MKYKYQDVSVAKEKILLPLPTQILSILTQSPAPNPLSSWVDF